MVHIRNEKESDYRQVEEMTRDAFYNLYVPGCDEHYLVHDMRSHADFVPELDFVLEENHRVVGNIMYTKARLVGDTGEEKQIVTFGPLCVAPGHQRKGYGKMLMEHSFQKAAELGYEVVVIFGSPSNYVSSGFQSCKRFNLCAENGTHPAAMLVKELKPGTLDGKKWIYHDSPVMCVDEKAAQRFDESFETRKKEWQTSQEEFYILSQAVIQ